MKRTILMLCMTAVLGLCRAASVDDTGLIVSDIYYDNTRQAWGMNISLINPDAPVTAFQCDVAIPTSTFCFSLGNGSFVVLLSDRAKETVYGEIQSTHSYAASLRPNGTLRIVVYSASNKPFSGNATGAEDGVVAFVPLVPFDETLSTDQTFQANLTNQVVSYVEDGVVESLYTYADVNDTELFCYDSMGRYATIYARPEGLDEDLLYETLNAVNSDIATYDRAVTLNLTHFLYWTDDFTFAPLNPNMLVFYAAARQMLNTENVFVKNEDTGVWTCSDLALYDSGLSFEQPFDLGDGVVAANFNFDREFPLGQWSTVMLPVSLSDEQLAVIRSEGTEIAALSAYDPETAVITYTNVETFEANKPYFIRPTLRTKVFADLADVPVAQTTGLAPVTAGNLAMYGNYDYTTISSTAEAIRYGYDSATGDFVRIGNNCILGPFRCYLELTGVSDAKAAPRIAIADAEANGIRSVTGGDGAPLRVFTLDGRRVDVSSVDDLPAGVYIVNGRKFVRH